MILEIVELWRFKWIKYKLENDTIAVSNDGYTPLGLSDIYWQIEDLITLNLLLIVDGIVLDVIDLSCYLNGAQSDGC